MVEHVRALLKREIEERFPKRPGQRGNPGGQRAIAEKFHMSQAALNGILTGKKEFGIDVLLGIRAYFVETGRPMTVDELLGLTADGVSRQEPPAAPPPRPTRHASGFVRKPTRRAG